MPQVTGRVYIKINGQSQPSKKGASLTYQGPNNITREMVVSDRNVEGYAESIKAPEISATFVHSALVSLENLSGIVDQTITFTTDTNISFIIRGGTQTGEIKLADGEVSVTFSGMSCEVA